MSTAGLSSPLSFAQQRLWFLDQLEPNSPLYNLPTVARLTGTLDTAALEGALDAVMSRHEALRARFVSLEGEPVQIFDEATNLRLERRDLTCIAEAKREGKLDRLIHEEVNRPFNLSAGPLLRATLLRLKPDVHVLILNIHHIIVDEWSLKVLFRELAAFYTGFVAGREVLLPELPIQYSDYAFWQREWLQSEDFARQLDFWKGQLSSNPPELELPADHPRRAMPGCPGAGQWLALDAELSQGLKRLASQERASLFMALLASFKALLHRYSQQEDIIIGSPLTGRNRLETEGLIGFFVNTLPLRTRLSGEMTFQQLLAQVRRVTLEAHSHQDLPFEKLLEALHPERSLTQVPYLRAVFLVQQDAAEGVDWPGLKVEHFSVGSDTAKFDLTVGVQETRKGLIVGTVYNPDLFDEGTIKRLLEHYEVLLRGIVAEPARRLSDLPLLSEAERRQLLIEWNQTRRDYPRNRCIQELFEEQARQRPSAVAVTSEEGEKERSTLTQRNSQEKPLSAEASSSSSSSLTYAELNGRANQLAHHLGKAGVKPRTIVGLCLERSAEMLVAMLGILKAGAAYAPLDPAAPRERLALMLEDLRVAVLLTQSRLRKGLPELSSPPVCLDTEWPVIAREPADNLSCEVEAEDLAYISFTSGSTGRPKGVCVPHRGVVRLVINADWASFSPNEVFIQTAPISFDASLLEIWGALLNGGRLVLPPPQLPSLADLAELIRRHQVTVAWFTTGLFNQMVEHAPEGLKALRQIMTGGEAASPPHIKKALRLLGNGSRLINGYGPTENSTFTTTYTVPARFDGRHSLPIGRPIGNTTCYVLDKSMQPVPIGVPGELYAGGDGLAKGYLNRPELTAERFVPHPFEPGSRLYKSGDLVRYLPDGNLEFLARMDLQVKIRGFRVELGEVESVLLRHPGVKQCVVTARPDPAGTKQLVAYILPARAPAPTPEDCRKFLRQQLPEYMVPAFFVSLPALPLSRNGKVERSALPAPQLKPATRDGPTPPRDELERHLLKLWEAILEVRPIGIRDGFFALGGHSLLAVRLVAQVEKTLGRKLPVAAVFENPTIAQLADLLRDGKGHGPGSSIVEIQPHGSKPPLLLVHGAGGGMFWGYSNLARHLDPDQPLFAFKSRGLDGLDELESIEALAEAYLADLRVFQPHEPYRLGGYCFGGLVAYEMARRLHAQGDKVALLALINTMPPNSSYDCFRWTPISTLRFAKNVFLKSLYSLPASPARWRALLRWRTRLLLRRLGRLWTADRRDPAGLDAEEWQDLSDYPAHQRRLWQTHLRAIFSYQPRPYAGQVTLFRCPLHQLYCSFDREYGWGEFALGGVALRIIPGAHDKIMEEPAVQSLATELQKCLMMAVP